MKKDDPNRLPSALKDDLRAVTAKAQTSEKAAVLAKERARSAKSRYKSARKAFKQAKKAAKKAAKIAARAQEELKVCLDSVVKERRRKAAQARRAAARLAASSGKAAATPSAKRRPQEFQSAGGTGLALPDSPNIPAAPLSRPVLPAGSEAGMA